MPVREWCHLRRSSALSTYYLQATIYNYSSFLLPTQLHKQNVIETYIYAMVLLTTTPSILSAIEALPPTSRHDISLPDTLNLEDPISHDQLIKIARYFRQKPTTDSSSSIDRSKTLNSLLRGTKVYVPPPPKKPEPVHTYPQHIPPPNTIHKQD